MSAYRLVVVAVFLSWTSLSAAQDSAQAPQVDRPLKILLIGNSITYWRHLASIVESFANAASPPRRWQVREHTMANARLSQMWGLRTTEYLLKDEPWDYIVLQEHRDIPTIRPEGLFSAARNFDAAARKKGAKIVLFENWGSAKSQPEVTGVFVKLAKELDVKVAPIGQAWVIVESLAPDLELRSGVGEGGHPAFLGMYVAGCVIYLTIADVDDCPPVLNGSIDERVSNVVREASRKAMANSRQAMLSR